MVSSIVVSVETPCSDVSNGSSNAGTGLYVWLRLVGLVCALVVSTSSLAFGQVPISQAGWTVHSVDSQETDVAGYGATNVFDGNPASMWATRWFAASPPAPHDIQINLGAVHDVSGFRYLPRQDGQPFGRIGQYQFFVSTDGTNWGTAVASGTFPNTGAEQQVLFTAKTGRYVRLRALTEVNGDPWTTVAELNVLVAGSQPPVISQAGWTLHFVDSQETDVAGYAATNAFDGNAASMWATRWFAVSPPPPHDIQINLGAVYDVTGFRYLPRQDGQPFGRVGQYQFFVSTDAANWGTAVASGTFPNSAAEQQVLFPAKAGRYIRLRVLTEVLGQPWTTVAELNVIAGGGGGGNQAPNGTISSPTGAVTIAPGQAVTFGGSGSDPDNNLPLTYAWNFGAGGPSPSTSQNPGDITFANAGVYAVTFTVRDALGAPDPTPATRTVTVQSPSSATLIPRAPWTVLFVDSVETSVGNFLVTNALDGDPDTAWTSQWFNGGPPPPHEFQIDLGAVHNVTGFRYRPYQPWQAGRIGEYEFYVSTDGSNWGTPVAAGAFPDINTGAARNVMFLPKMGRYVRLRALTEVNNGDYVFTAISEFNVWQAGIGANQAPTASIGSPAQNVTIAAGSAIDLFGAAADPDSNLPLEYRWSVGPGSGIADVTVLNPDVVHFDRPGTFPLTFTVSDALGKTTTATRTVTVVGGQLLANTGWALHFVDSQETAGYSATNAFDGNPSTMWVTQWMSAEPPPPHEIQIDLGATRQVSGFVYLPRQDGFTVGNIGEYLFYVSADGVNWGSPVASGTFADDGSAKQVAFAVTSGRYVRLRALTEVNGWPYTAVAELQILQRQCFAPSVQLLQPRSGYLQRSSTLQLVADACLSQAGQGVRFVVDGVTLANDFAAPYTLTTPALNAAEHIVEAYLVDSSGNPVIGDAAYDRATPVGIGDFYVAMGDGISIGYGDNIATDDNSADGRNLLGGYTPILADGLTAARGYPVTVVNEGKAGTTSAHGAASIGTLLQQYPNANYFLLMYGHNDAAGHMPSGLGLTPQSVGYAGSYKDYVQRIINAVRAAGRVVLLSKPSAAIPIGGQEDTAIQEYGMVIAELVADVNNGITVQPPEFHTHFMTRTTTHYSSAVELNGLGYQEMAQLWLQAILGAP